MLTNEQIENWNPHIVRENEPVVVKSNYMPQECLKMKFVKENPTRFGLALGLYCPCPACSAWC